MSRAADRTRDVTFWADVATLPAQVWTRIKDGTIVEVPFWPRDPWARDVLLADLIGGEDDAHIWVPIEVPDRLRYDNEMYILMRTDPWPIYWRETSPTERIDSAGS